MATFTHLNVRRWWIVLLMALGFAFPAWAASDVTQTDNADAVTAIIELLQEKGIIEEREAESILDRHHRKLDRQRSIEEGLMPRQDLLIEKVEKNVERQREQEMQQMREQIDRINDAILTRTRLAERRVDHLEKRVDEDLLSRINKSSWAQRIRFGGDIRLRHQSDYLSPDNDVFNNPPNFTTPINTRTDQHRQRIRVRLQAKATIVDPREVNVGKVEAGIRVASGDPDNPVSTNETFGTYDSKSDIVLDRAYVNWTWKPESVVWGGKLPKVSISGGRIANPWFATDLVWDSDLSFDGFAFNFQTDTVDGSRFNSFFTMGAFSLSSGWNLNSGWQDKWLYGGQVGVEHRPRFDVRYKLGIGFFDYRDIVGRANADLILGNATDWTLPGFLQKGNTLFNINQTGAGLQKWGLASEFNLLNVTATVDNTMFMPLHIVLSADYVQNLGYDSEDIARRLLSGDLSGATYADVAAYVDRSTGDTGYQIGMLVGYPQVRHYGHWNLALHYKYIESDAVLDAFTDSDFHLGGTNAKGWTLNGQFGLYSNVWLNARWITTNEISGPRLEADTLQMDVNAAF